MKTIAYYNEHAEDFAASTFSVDMESLYQPFLENLSPTARILDLGCACRRDTFAFKTKGYQVDAMDYSEALVKKATELTGIPVRQQSFYELEDVEIYDGIWACASLLHCERERLPEVIGRMLRSLKPSGVIYMSFKYGDSDREKDGRYFTDLNEQQAESILQQVVPHTLLKLWLTVDQRPDRQEKWLNLLIQKQ